MLAPGGRARPRTGSRATAGAAQLLDGRVLAAGGGCYSQQSGIASAELFDPVVVAWAPTQALMSARRIGPGVAVLPSGKVLVAGGREACLGARSQPAELLDPVSGRWIPAGGMHARRGMNFWRVSATLISSDPDGFAADPARCGSNCGKVLITGSSPLGAAELYVPRPDVTSVSPSSGPSAGRTSVTVTGRGFTHGVREVRFGATPATSFGVDSYGRLTAVAPEQTAGTVDVTVVNEGGEATRANAFAYEAAPPGETPADPVPPGNDPAGGPGQDLAPAITAMTLSEDRFRVDSRGRAARLAPRGTTIGFRLSEAARVRFTIERVRNGRRVNGRCRRPRRSDRRAPRCRLLAASGGFSAPGRPGANRVRFSGRLRGRGALRPGRYRLTIVATDPAGHRSRPRRASFTVVRR